MDEVFCNNCNIENLEYKICFRRLRLNIMLKISRMIVSIRESMAIVEISKAIRFHIEVCMEVMEVTPARNLVYASYSHR